jgi:protein gp37
MGDRSKIEWTEASWNPIRAANKATGRDGHFCVHVSEGCRNCYAERMQVRFGNPVRFAAQDRDKVQVLLHETALTQPLRWKRPRRIFPCSMSDIAGDWVTDEMLDRMFAVMALTPWHTYQVLTKRPERMRLYVSTPGREIAVQLAAFMMHQEAFVAGGTQFGSIRYDTSAHTWHMPWPLPNVGLGTSVEDQATAAARIPELLATPAAVRWLSAEPLLGPLDLTAACGGAWSCEACCGWRGTDFHAIMRDVDGEMLCPACGSVANDSVPLPLDWVVCGGESGIKARPMHPAWARSLRDQCAAAGVAFFFKQWGEWGPDTGPELVVGEVIVEDRIMEGRARCAWWTGAGWTYEQDGYAVDLAAAEGSGEWLYRLGKKHNGRLLDGVTHDGYPAVRP